MENVKVKFRGIDTEKNCRIFYTMGSRGGVKDIVQLCGYDVNGKEVYEGDILVDEHGTEHKVFMTSMFAVSDKYALDLNPAMAALFQLKLKEEEK